MQVIKDGIVKDYYISKNLPDNPSMKLLNHKLKYVERLIFDRGKYIEQQRLWIKYDESELNRVNDNKMRDKIKKSIEEKKDSIKRSLHDLGVEKEDLEALKNIIEMEIFLGC